MAACDSSIERMRCSKIRNLTCMGRSCTRILSTCSANDSLCFSVPFVWLLAHKLTAADKTGPRLQCAAIKNGTERDDFFFRLFLLQGGTGATGGTAGVNGSSGWCRERDQGVSVLRDRSAGTTRSHPPVPLWTRNSPSGPP